MDIEILWTRGFNLAFIIFHCRMTNYELLRWLVETPSRDVQRYRMITASRSTGSHYKIVSVSLRKWPHAHGFTNKAYLSAIKATNISKSFTYKMAPKLNLHRYGTKSRHRYPMYTNRPFGRQRRYTKRLIVQRIVADRICILCGNARAKVLRT